MANQDLIQKSVNETFEEFKKYSPTDYKRISGRKKLGRWNAHTRSLLLAVMRSRTLSPLDPLSGQEKWRRLAGGRFGFIALYLKISAIYN